jgi:GNAT superfamily N-acetyltransferase
MNEKHCPKSHKKAKTMFTYQGYTIYTETEYLALEGTPEAPTGFDAILDAWKPFMLEDNLAGDYWSPYKRIYGDDQYLIVDDSHTILARVENISLFWDDDWNNLPARGWDWALQTGVEQHKVGIAPNIMCAISIAIAPHAQGKGLSRVAIHLMRQRAKEKGFSHLIAPVRPSQKSLYPLMPMQNYIRWRREDGQLMDAWLRTHEKLGARLVKVAPQAMRIAYPAEQWQAWTGLRFDWNGDYIVDGALVPVVAKDGFVTYVEPNVWMVHGVT